ncbi:selenoprotein K-like [Mytilus californianus]|uniref:selenoprotein K-like n=1 Tax=Mytilus californianus TaxID=6549 RepID=UPI00224519BD|nr:selenoprotein K-like [Mytilus californianus]
MVYVGQGGQMLDSRSPWRLSVIPELFWSIVNFFVLFFRTLINPSLSKEGSTYSRDYRSGGGGGPPAPPRRRMGGFRGGGGAPSPPPMGGG